MVSIKTVNVNDKKLKIKPLREGEGVGRPVFPKRAVVTAGMPYGNKALHFGHMGGVFIHADTFARFLRDRIGKENVIFVSGTDCYGSPIVENYNRIKEDGSFSGSLEDFVRLNHDLQKETLKAYEIDINLFAASAFGRAAEIHRDVTFDIINKLYEDGHLVKLTSSQFYDPEMDVLLNGRQVVGRCPIDGCSSDKGYADECSLGHQYMPEDLINPKSTLSGKKPEMRDVDNWYFKLEEFHKLLSDWVKGLKANPDTRRFMMKSIEEFLEPPVIYVMKDYLETIDSLKDRLPEYEFKDDGKKKSSAMLIFKSLKDRENACKVLASHEVRYRTGKTLVPFRLTGNIEWGVPAPALEGLKDLTVWVWPESLWAPISFTKTYLEGDYKGQDKDWTKWWSSKEAGVFQFIGQDNIYFYGPAEMAMFMGTQGTDPISDPPEGDLQLPEIIANNHVLFLDKKASSSGKVKPPMADELLSYYTPEQLRAHFLGLGLGIRSVSFKPKPLDPTAPEKGGDPALKEGNLLTNVFNRAIRSCFYTVQKYHDGIIPVREISKDILAEAQETVFKYERLMYKYEFHQVMNVMDTYIRNTNKYWSKEIREADAAEDDEGRAQLLADTFYMVGIASVLMHPIAPLGTEMILEYLRLDESFWSWDRIFDTHYDFMDDPHKHKLKFLEPRVDFFEKHPSQYK
ncbi:MAG TPA: class I tRNA ligase family protein [Bacillota bacterium]|nr:class I tRNA ligase family protein [Bacillota bacterium]